MRFALDDLERSPKQHGRYLGLWDSPWYRDWLVWFGGSWTLLMFVSSAFPTDPDASTSNLPRWLDTVLATVVVAALFGFLPAYLRGVLRRRRRRRRRPSVASPVDAASPAPRQAGLRSEWTAAPPTSAAADGAAAPASTMLTGPSLEERSPSQEPAPSPSGGRQALDGSMSAPTSDPGSEVLTRSRQSLPYPIARAVRALQLATEPTESYRAALRCAEAVTVVLGIVSTAWAREHGIVTPQITSLQEGYQRGIAQGHWEAVASALPRAARDHPMALPGMLEAWKPRKGEAGLSNDLKSFIQERNAAAHGGEPHNRLEAAERLSSMTPTLERILSRASFLGDSPWIVVRATRYRRRERDFEVTALRVMGDHPDFEVVRFVARRPLANDVMYVLTEHGPLDLTPLIVLRDCPTCRQPEVAYADRIDQRKGVCLKTFDRGHVLYDHSLVAEVGHLFSPAQPGEIAT